MQCANLGKQHLHLKVSEPPAEAHASAVAEGKGGERMQPLIGRILQPARGLERRRVLHVLLHAARHQCREYHLYLKKIVAFVEKFWFIILEESDKIESNVCLNTVSW